MPENLALALGPEGGVGTSFNALTPLLMRWLNGRRGAAEAPAAPAPPAAAAEEASPAPQPPAPPLLHAETQGFAASAKLAGVVHIEPPTVPSRVPDHPRRGPSADRPGGAA
jgi:hypothetical protein